MEAVTLFSVISTAFLLSFTHCAGMCGGFTVAYTFRLGKIKPLKALFYSLFYHSFRIFAYMILGCLFAYFGSKIVISPNFRAYMYFFIGIFLVIFALAIFFRGFLLEIIENKYISKLIMPLFSYFSKKNGLLSFATLGFLNGLLPCGVVYYFLLLSFSQNSMLHGVMIMGVFGLSTLPAMLLIGALANKINTNLKKIANIISAVIMCLYGLYMAFLGFSAI